MLQGGGIVSVDFRVDNNVYMMVMTKKEDLLEYSKHDVSVNEEYTTFGYFDFVHFQKINSIDEMLKVPGHFEGSIPEGDALVHNFSLFTVDDNDPFLKADGAESFEESFLKQNITMISMIKLDPRVITNRYKEVAGCQSDCLGKATGLDVLVEAKKAIMCGIRTKFPEQHLGIKVFFSLSTYDLVVFLSTDDPNVTSKAMLHIKASFPALSFSTSFFIFNYSNKLDWEDFKKTYKPRFEPHKTGLRIRAALREYICANDFKTSVIKGLGKSNDTAELNSIVGYVPGDEDVAIAIESIDSFSVLSLYHPNNPNNLIKLKLDFGSRSVVVNDCIRRLHSTFGYFNFPEINETGQNCAQQGFIWLEKEDKEKRFTFLRSFYGIVSEKYGEEREIIPERAKYHVENILANCLHLAGLSNHQGTAFSFLKLLKTGLEHHRLYHNKHESVGNEKNSDAGPFVYFAIDLAAALNSITSSESVYMNKIVDLYPMNSYAKLLSAFRNILGDIYSILPLKIEDDKPTLLPFLTIGRVIKTRCNQYFNLSDSYHRDARLVSLHMPLPSYFDLEKSYCEVLHEVAHLQYNTEDNAANETLRDTVLQYISLLIASNLINSSLPTKYTDIFEKLSNTSAIIDLNNDIQCSGVRVRAAEYISKLNSALMCIKNDIFELLENVHAKDSELISLMHQGMFELINTLRHSLIEARTDVMMIEMLGDNFGLCNYLSIWDKHFSAYDSDRLNNARHNASFIYRCCFVLAYFEDTGSFTLDGTKPPEVSINGRSFEYLIECYKGIRLLAPYFIEYIRFMRNLPNRQNRDLSQLLKEVWSKRVTNAPRLLESFEINGQIEFYINHWFADLAETEKLLDLKASK